MNLIILVVYVVFFPVGFAPAPEHVRSILIDKNKVQSANNEEVLYREKRKVLSHDVYPYSKWPTEVPFYIEPGMSEENKGHLLRIIQEEFEANTCLRFKELKSIINVTTHHLMFRESEELECSSYIGRFNDTDSYPSQPIRLNDICFYYRNFLIASIARALGIVEEIKRSDRDEYVVIQWNNIAEDHWMDLYSFSSELIGYLYVPYDYGSVTHQRANAYLEPSLEDRYSYPDIENDQSYTIRPLDGKLLRVLGQVSELSYYDAMALNKVYCSDTCNVSLVCSNGGYQDPSNCAKCLCPDGFSGDRCNELDEHVSNSLYGCTPNSGIITVTTEQQCVSSPGFGTGEYNVGDKCSWLLRAQDFKTIDMWFSTSTFEVVNFLNQCEHWVEIKYRGLDYTRGPRYCSVSEDVTDTSLPTINSKLRSESYEVLIIFKSPGGTLLDLLTLLHRKGGFELCFTISRDDTSGSDENEGGSGEDSFGLNTGVLVVIIILGLAAVALGTSLVVFCLCKRRTDTDAPASDGTTATSNHPDDEITVPQLPREDALSCDDAETTNNQFAISGLTPNPEEVPEVRFHDNAICVATPASFIDEQRPKRPIPAPRKKNTPHSYIGKRDN